MSNFETKVLDSVEVEIAIARNREQESQNQKGIVEEELLWNQKHTLIRCSRDGVRKRREVWKRERDQDSQFEGGGRDRGRRKRT
jgi:hypothetical protein